MTLGDGQRERVEKNLRQALGGLAEIEEILSEEDNRSAAILELDDARDHLLSLGQHMGFDPIDLEQAHL